MKWNNILANKAVLVAFEEEEYERKTSISDLHQLCHGHDRFQDRI